MVVPWGVLFKQPPGGSLLWFPGEVYLSNHLVVVPWGGLFKLPPGGCLLSAPQSGSTIKVAFLFRDLPYVESFRSPSKLPARRSHSSRGARSGYGPATLISSKSDFSTMGQPKTRPGIPADNEKY